MVALCGFREETAFRHTFGVDYELIYATPFSFSSLHAGNNEVQRGRKHRLAVGVALLVYRIGPRCNTPARPQAFRIGALQAQERPTLLLRWTAFGGPLALFFAATRTEKTSRVFFFRPPPLSLDHKKGFRTRTPVARGFFRELYFGGKRRCFQFFYQKSRKNRDCV